MTEKKENDPPARMTAADFEALGSDLSRLSSKSVVGFLSDAARGERERLFLFAVGCLLVLSAKVPPALKAPLFDGSWQPVDPRLLPTGITFALAYYWFSFLVLALTDLARFRVDLSDAATTASRWNLRLMQHSSDIADEEQTLIDAAKAQSVAEIEALKVRLANATERSEAAEYGTEAYEDAAREVQVISEAMRLGQGSFRVDPDRAVAIARDRALAESAGAVLDQQLARWLAVRTWHRLASLIIPALFGGVVLALMVWRLWLLWSAAVAPTPG